MNKKEILNKSRLERDEGLDFAENQGRKAGYIVFTIIFVVIVLFNFFRGVSNYAVFAMFWAFIGAEAYPKYKFTGQKVYLVTTISGLTASLASLLNYILTVLRS